MSSVNTADFSESELEKADYRVGTSSKEAVQWLIKFSQLDLSGLSAGDMHNLQYEILSFVSLWSSRVTSEVFWSKDSAPKIEKPYKQLFKTVSLAKDVPSLQQHARDCIADVVGRQHIVIELNKVRFGLFFPPRSGGHPRLLVLSFTPKAPFYFAMLTLLERHSGHLKACPWCQRHFVLARRNQKYCSIRCQMLAATHRYRQAHGLGTGKRGRPKKNLLRRSK